MNFVKKLMIVAGLVGTFASFAGIAYAAPISFERGTGTTIEWSDSKKKWESRAFTYGSYGTVYTRTYTEIYAGGVKKDWKNSEKVKGSNSSAFAYAPSGYDDIEALSGHRIWWTDDIEDSCLWTQKPNYKFYN
ncbi:hypothetical protein [Brevibacillus borstelensis]|uniref:hypothetical protein n=1 Tax=Brevibacillus borstelensis TaxID=45462 RepID=UPI0030C576D8